jgi:hypothetical protein
MNRYRLLTTRGLPASVVLAAVLLAALLLAACGAPGTPAPTATPAPPTPIPHYAHADDYSWIAGNYQVTGIQGGCAYLTYDARGGDAYGGRVVISGELPGVKSGDWVLVYGRLGSEVSEACPGQPYTVDRVETRPGPVDS